MRGGEPAHDPEGEHDLSRASQGRVTAREDEPQPVIRGGFDRPVQFRQLGAVVLLAAEHVEPAVAGDGEQPGVGTGGDAFGGPSPDRGLEGVLDEIFSGREVAGHPGQRGGQPAGVLANHADQRGVLLRSVCAPERGVGLVHASTGRISTTGQPGQERTMRSASSKSATSISQ